MSLQVLAQETEAQSKKLAGMEAGAACLTQDNGPCSLMGNAKERLAKALQQVSERGEVLEVAHQQAKQVSHTKTPEGQWEIGGGGAGVSREV